MTTPNASSVSAEAKAGRFANDPDRDYERDEFVSASADTTKTLEGIARQRKHLVQSAGYWFDGSRKAQAEGKSAEAVAFMENAYNHVENALAATQESLRALQSAARAGQPEVEKLRNTIENIRANAVCSIPFYAYGDNEAACEMSNRLGAVVGLCDAALAATPQPITEESRSRGDILNGEKTAGPSQK